MGIKIRKVYNVKNKEVVAMAKEIDYSKIGLRISSLRKKAGLTQEVLAARCGCTLVMWKWENVSLLLIW